MPDEKEKKMRDVYPLEIVFRVDPNEEKEDKRPIENRKLPRSSIDWPRSR